MHCLSHATLAEAGRGGGGNTSSNNNGSTNITITIPKTSASSSDINLLGDFEPSATSGFVYEIYFENTSYKSEHKTASEGGTVTFDNVKYDTYDFCLDIYVHSNKKTKLTTIKVNKTVSASMNTVQFPDMKTSDYSEWFLVKDADGLRKAVSDILSKFTAEKKAKLCLLDNIELPGFEALLATIEEKYEKIDNGFKIAEELFDITIASPIDGGTVTASPTKAALGDPITLTITPGEEKELDTLTVTGVAAINKNEAKTEATFTMPSSDVTVTASFKTKKYTLSLPSSTGGSVTVSDAPETLQFAKGDTITLVITPDSDDYRLKTLTVDGTDVTTSVTSSNEYPFTMPNHDVTVEAVFKKYYTVTFQNHNANQVGDPHGYFEGDTLTFDDATAILADSVPTGREIVAFYKIASSTTNVFKKNSQITFNSDIAQNITLRAILDLEHSRVDGGYAPVGYNFDTQDGSFNNPYIMNYYGNDTNKSNQVKIKISGNVSAASTVSAAVEDSAAAAFEGITRTDASYPEFIVKILSTIGTPPLSQVKVTVTDNATDSTKDFYVRIVYGKVGSKSAPDTVGDIVFNDGTAEAYTETLALSNAQKNAAIAVIFDADNKKGVGLKQGTSLKWCTNYAAAYNDITYATSTTDGSANMTSIKALGDYSKDSYPAFYFADHYSTESGATNLESYTSNWYLPARDELLALFANKATVNLALSYVGGTQLSDTDNEVYWSSSNYASTLSYTFEIGYSETGGSAGTYKYDTYPYVCCIRVF